MQNIQEKSEEKQRIFTRYKSAAWSNEYSLSWVCKYISDEEIIDIASVE